MILAPLTVPKKSRLLPAFLLPSVAPGLHERIQRPLAGVHPCKSLRACSLENIMIRSLLFIAVLAGALTGAALANGGNMGGNMGANNGAFPPPHNIASSTGR